MICILSIKKLPKELLKIMRLAQEKLHLSARAYHRVLRVARTIADLAQSKTIEVPHLTEALSYRNQLEN